MKDVRKVIGAGSLQTRLPFWQTIILALALDRLGAPLWIWSALGVIVVLVWGTLLVAWWQEKVVEIDIHLIEKVN